MYCRSCTDIDPDPSDCSPCTSEKCHENATCIAVSPFYLCSSKRANSYKCECNYGYIGDGINCTGKGILPVENE